MRKFVVVAALIVAACASERPEPPTAAPTSITLNAADREAIERAVDQAGRQPLKVSVPWANAQNGTGGRVTALREGFTEAGRKCREYHVLVTQGSLQGHEVGFACQSEDGSWRSTDS